MKRVEKKSFAAFTLAELLVVIGVIALLIALIVPPLAIARLQAMKAKCMRQLQQNGLALEAARSEYDFYPIWDDNQDPVRFTWIDVLVQRRYVVDYRVGYCPEDSRPDQLNAARGSSLRVNYPGAGGAQSGIDYSYGIGVPLSAGGWTWRDGYSPTGDRRQRRFEDRDRDTSGRILAGDGNWSFIYNLSGNATRSAIWNDPDWYDNTVAWRHGPLTANLLLQDGHVASLTYKPESPEPVNTNRFFLWYAREPLHVGPDSRWGRNFYPNEPPPGFAALPPSTAYPDDLDPTFYSDRQIWTLIRHK